MQSLYALRYPLAESGRIIGGTEGTAGREDLPAAGGVIARQKAIWLWVNRFDAFCRLSSSQPPKCRGSVAY